MEEDEKEVETAVAEDQNDSPVSDQSGVDEPALVEESGITDTLETLEMLKDLAVFGASVMKDKKLTIGDLSYVKDLVLEYSDIKKGIDGISNIKTEFKNLDSDEVEQILNKLEDAIAAVKNAYTA